MKEDVSDKLEAAADVALSVIKEVLEARDHGPGALRLARIATGTVSNYAHMVSARSSRERTVVSLVTHAADTTDEFRRLVTAALPGHPVSNALAIEAPKQAIIRKGSKRNRNGR